MNKKIYFAIGFIVLNLLVYFFTQQNKNQRIDLALDNHITKLQTHFEILMHQQKLNANGIFESSLKKPEVVETLSKAYRATNQQQKDELRKKLFLLLKDRYQRMIKKGVLQFHFVFPDNEVFLRFHKPEKYGDNLTQVRKDFAYTNKTLKRVNGFAQGRTAHAFRNVYPIFDKKSNHIGAMEISFSTEGVQNNFTLISKMHTHFLVDKKIFDAKTWDRDDLIVKYNKSAEHPNYMITMTNQHSVETCITQNKKNLENVAETIKQKINIGKSFALYTQDEHNWVISVAFIPVYGNIENKILAWIVSYEKDPFIAISIKNTRIIRIVLFVVLLLLFYFIYKTVNQKEILAKDVQKKTLELKEINENLEQKIIIEVEKSKNIEKKLFHSEKMAAMGEMIGNIAHQWRQPLSVISTSATGLQVQQEFGLLDDDMIHKSCEQINNNAQYLSKTIDDFKNFIKGDHVVQKFSLNENIESFIHLIEGEIKNNYIDVELDLQKDNEVQGYPNELTQCFINIFNNAKDALKNTVQGERIFIIRTEMKNSELNIYFQDSAGGIEKEILPKVFDPYFTTKHQEQGTGLGLHMTYNLIEKGMHGKLEIKNNSFKYKENFYKGALVTITLPMVL
ncbi:MAG: HAMP domain-containing sensor histidine kinase [Campylobacterota bacterium]|nr:HAMP domain-containing sensor histidine kinase [Campylobacterota bacterium]